MKQAGRRSRFLRTAATVGVLLLVLGIQVSAPTWAASCSAGITPFVMTEGPFLVGDEVTLNLKLQVFSIQKGTKITIPTVMHRLDCAVTQAGQELLFDDCVHELETLVFRNMVGTDCPGVTWTAQTNHFPAN